jgi:ABC-type transport system involved in multi-copper enzyme maturation permease subunit
MPTILRWVLRLGPTNPIAVRLVQNGSRRTRHLYIRAAYLAALIFLVLWMMLAGGVGGAPSYRTLAASGAQTFIYAAYLQIGLICILAPVFMAGAIAQEANPRTWDIMLTTPLSSTEIVLGNLFGRLFFILALLAASLPLFALTQYFGGVPGTSIFISYLIAGCAALLVGASAIALSVSRLVGRRAVFAFYVSVVSYLAVTFAVDRWLVANGMGASGGRGVTWMTPINPFLALHALLNPSTYPRAEPGSMQGPASWFLESPVSAWCWLSVILSVVLMGVSTATVRTGGLANIASGTSGIPLHRRLLRLGPSDAERHRAPRSVWTNPIAWREAAARNATLGRIVARWSFIALGGLFGVGLVWLYWRGSFSADDFRLAIKTTVWAELAVITLVGINMAATAVSREREDGTLDLLLTTPITPGQYLAGKLRGLIAYLIPLLAVPVGTIGLAGLYAAGGERVGGQGAGVVQAQVGVGATAAALDVPVVLPEAGLIAAVVVLPFTAFCVMVGLQWSLKSKWTIASGVSTVGVVGVVSGIVGLCGWHAGGGLAMLGPVLSGLSPASVVFALTEPESGMAGTVSAQDGLAGARVALLVGALAAAGAYAAIVYGIHTNMVRTFDFTVRRLAGIR